MEKLSSLALFFSQRYVVPQRLLPQSHLLCHLSSVTRCDKRQLSSSDGEPRGTWVKRRWFLRAGLGPEDGSFGWLFCFARSPMPGTVCSPSPAPCVRPPEKGAGFTKGASSSCCPPSPLCLSFLPTVLPLLPDHLLQPDAI